MHVFLYKKLCYKYSYFSKQTKIDVNRRNFTGNTALHTAIVTPGSKAKEICALLLKYGADPHLRNYNRELSVVCTIACS